MSFPMSAPIASKPLCDVKGCGMPAAMSTSGSEIDSQGLGRPALPKLNLCERHHNWAHSDDAKNFANDPNSPYKGR